MRPGASIEIVGTNGHPEIVDDADLGVDIDGAAVGVLQVIDRATSVTSSIEFADDSLSRESARATDEASGRIGKSWDDDDEPQRRFPTERFAEQPGGIHRPEVLILEVNKASRLGE